MKKRISIVLLVLILAITLLPSAAAAASDTSTLNGHQYQRFDNGMTWEDAKEYCEDLGGHLATVTSKEEQTLIESLISSGTQHQYWLGGHADSGWTWVTGETWNFTNWDAIEPNDYRGNEGYVQIYRIPNPAVSGSEAFGWNDISNDNCIPGEEDFFSTGHVGFICEWDAPKPAYKASTWAKEELNEADSMGLIPDCLKKADLTKPINRAEFAAVSVKAYEALTGQITAPGSNPFTDTSDSEILKAYKLGITNGTSATTFSPTTTLNREQASTMLTRVLKKAAASYWTLDTDGQYTLIYSRPGLFADNDQISGYAWDSVYFMAANGIINGTGNNKFSPRAATDSKTAIGYASATREQAVLISLRMAKYAAGRDLSGVVSTRASESKNVSSNRIDDYVPKGYDWYGNMGMDESFIDGKWVSPDGQSVLYISHDEGPDGFSIWFYSCKEGKAVYDQCSLLYADVIKDGEAVCNACGLRFVAVRSGILVETDWTEDMYSRYGKPDGIYGLSKARQ